MATMWKVLCTALAAGACLASSRAEAHVGGHAPRLEPTATATPRPPDDAGEPPEDAPVRVRIRGPMGAISATLRMRAPRRERRGPPSRAENAPDDTRAPLLVRMGVQGARMGDGGALGLFLTLDGMKAGIDLRVTGLTFPVDDGTNSLDHLTVLGTHLTVALVSTERGRLRVEAGVASAHAPGVLFVGPSFAASGEACIGESRWDVEGRVQATPFPYRQVEAQAGVALHLGAFNLRGGWHGLYLDDTGLLPGIEHQDALAGPYFGMGFAF
ncbi:hypothetical protein KRR26_31545 [Corallococcus sp. M34]|nr:hypothetical protein [Citreicoccus inhibens]